MKYEHSPIEEKWRKIWQEQNLYKVDTSTKKEKYYVLDMFPYPSGEGLHVGHPKGYIATDVLARQKMMQGLAVLHPMGWDAFGLPAENYAIQNKVHPSVAVAKNIIRFKEQLEKIGFSYDWSREINTTDPNYYKWTQWAFIKMFEAGLAYESFEPINWCPSCKTGLANEDLEDGRCERCGSIVEKKPMRQWMLRITKYADRLLEDLNLLEWPESIKESQRNWIGKSEGAEFVFTIKDSAENIVVFTTRADTLFGATYVVLAPEHPLIHKLEEKIENIKEVKKYIEAAAKKTEIDRTAAGKEKTGVLLKGIVAINPANNEEIPVYTADYVLGDYGTGAVMAVPAHDERDYEFAKKYELPIKQVIAPFFVDEENKPIEGKKWSPRRNVHAVIKHPSEDKVVQLQWKEQPWKTFVIGGVEEGESYEDAVIREVKEETGFKNFKKIEKLGWEMEAHFYAAHKDVNRQSFPRFFLIQLKDLEKDELSVEEAAKHTVAWVPFSDIKKTFWPVSELPEVLANLEKGPHAFVGDGKTVYSNDYSGFDSAEARTKITKDFGKTITRYKLRDWVFSRQRYWGEPIPIIHCEKCGVVPVPEKDLPVVLPEVESYEPTGTGESPLAGIFNWVNVNCPKCGGEGKRETNTMPQWAGSSWYYLRYIDPNNDKKLVDPSLEKKWSPVDMYVGGAEHATRHLIYARFWHKFLFDSKVVSHPEPFVRYSNQGLIMGADGRKMGKRYGNVINPDDMVEKFGADAFRIYEMFLSPFTQAANFSESGVAAAKSFINRMFLLEEKVSKEINNEAACVSLIHQTIKKVGDDINNFKFNTAVSSLMILTNALALEEKINAQDFSILVRLIAPFAPHAAEELWEKLGNTESVFKSEWPQYDESKLVNEMTTIAVQVNGRLRDTFDMASDSSEEEIKKEAMSRPGVTKWTDGHEIKKVIVVKGKIVSIVL